MPCFFHNCEVLRRLQDRFGGYIENIVDYSCLLFALLLFIAVILMLVWAIVLIAKRRRRGLFPALFLVAMCIIFTLRICQFVMQYFVPYVDPMPIPIYGGTLHFGAHIMLIVSSIASHIIFLIGFALIMKSWVYHFMRLQFKISVPKSVDYFVYVGVSLGLVVLVAVLVLQIAVNIAIFYANTEVSVSIILFQMVIRDTIEGFCDSSFGLIVIITGLRIVSTLEFYREEGESKKLTFGTDGIERAEYLSKKIRTLAIITGMALLGSGTFNFFETLANLFFLLENMYCQDSIVPGNFSEFHDMLCFYSYFSVQLISALRLSIQFIIIFIFEFGMMLVLAYYIVSHPKVRLANVPQWDAVQSYEELYKDEGETFDEFINYPMKFEA